ALYNRASQRWMLLVSTIARPPISTLFPYTTLFRSLGEDDRDVPFGRGVEDGRVQPRQHLLPDPTVIGRVGAGEDRIDSLGGPGRSEEHTSELQSRFDLVCRLLLEKKKGIAVGGGDE